MVIMRRHQPDRSTIGNFIRIYDEVLIEELLAALVKHRPG
jgi:hypothetical protein